jgi:hypothetical protein
MLQPYHLTIRFRQHANDALLDLETDDGAADVATFVPPFGDDLPLVLRALDWAQFPPGARPPWLFDADAQARLTALGLWEGRRPAEDIHARVGRALYAALNVEPAATIIQQARASARANGQPLELVLRFARSSAALADLPWEALWEDVEAGGLPLLLAQGGRSSCVRYLSLPRPARACPDAVGRLAARWHPRTFAPRTARCPLQGAAAATRFAALHIDYARAAADSGGSARTC